MDGCGITLLLAGFVAYFVTKRKYAWFLFATGLGTGILIGAIWAYFITSVAIDKFLP